MEYEHEDIVKVGKFLVDELDWSGSEVLSFFDEPHKYISKYFPLAELWSLKLEHYTVHCDECGDSQEIKGDDGTIDWEEGTAYITCKSIDCPSNAEMQDVKL